MVPEWTPTRLPFQRDPRSQIGRKRHSTVRTGQCGFSPRLAPYELRKCEQVTLRPWASVPSTGIQQALRENVGTSPGHRVGVLSLPGAPRGDLGCSYACQWHPGLNLHLQPESWGLHAGEVGVRPAATVLTLTLAGQKLSTGYPGAQRTTQLAGHLSSRQTGTHGDLTMGAAE